MEEKRQEYLTEEQARTVKELFKKYLRSYKEKDANMTDQEWLEQLFRTELPEMNEEEIKQDSEEIVTAIRTFDENLASCTEASKKGRCFGEKCRWAYNDESELGWKYCRKHDC